MTDKIPLCGAKCPHGTAACTLPADGHAQHEVYGDRYPGNPREKSMCTWKRAR